MSTYGVILSCKTGYLTMFICVDMQSMCAQGIMLSEISHKNTNTIWFHLR